MSVYIMIDDVNVMNYGFEPGKEIFNPTPNILHHTEQIEGRDGLFDLGSSLGQRELVFSGQFYADSMTDLEANLSEVKRILYDDGTEKKIRCSRWPNLRFWGKLNGLFSPEYWEPTLKSAVCDAVIRMITLTRPWGESISTSEFIRPVSSGATVQVKNEGHLPVPPEITLRVIGVTSGSVTDVTITNLRTNKSITLSGTYNHGDIIVIDCDKHTVAKNGSSEMANQSGVFLVIDRDLSVEKTDDEGNTYTDNIQTQLKVDYTPSNTARLKIEVRFRERFL